MKKSFLLSVALFCISFGAVKAQTVLFSGDATPSKFSRMDIISWAMGETLEKGHYVNFGTAEAPAFTEVTTNPDKSGINKTDNCMHMYSLRGHSWWPDFLVMNIEEPITITEENRYLHVYHYRENLNEGFSLYLADGTLLEDPDKGTKRFDLQLSKAGVWEDVVVDLKWFMENETPLSAISFLVDRNWGGGEQPATHYYWDEIELNNSRLPRGIKIAEETELSIDLGNEASYNNWVAKLDTQHADNSAEIVTNPFADQKEVLNTPTLMKFNKSENASWWQGGPRFQLDKSLKVGIEGASSFLHVFVNIPNPETSRDFYVVELNAKDFSGSQLSSGDVNKYWTDEKGVWVDMVLDVTSLGYVSEFSVRFDVRRNDADEHINSPAGIFYLDDIVINGSEEPREKSTLVSVKQVGAQASNVRTFARNQHIVVEGNAVKAEIFTLTGSKVSSSKIENSFLEIPVSQRGIYLVRTIDANNIISSSKVMVN